MTKTNQRIKVLYMSPTPPPIGGMAKWTETLLKYGLPAPFETRFIDISLPPKQQMFRLAKIDKVALKRTVRILFSLIKMSFSFHPHIMHLCCSLSPHGIIRDYICARLSKFLGQKVITHYHGNIVDFSQSALRGLSYKFLVGLIKISDVNLSLNSASFEFIRRIQEIKHCKHNYLLPNFIDDAVFTQAAFGREKTQKKLRAIYVGGITRQKGVHDIIKVAPEFKDIEFVLIGESPLASDCSFINNVPGNVSLLPQMKNSEVLKELKRSDFFFFLSHTEGFPYAVLEAMATGLPIVATNVGAIPEMVVDGRGGFLCESQNIKQIKQALYKLKSIKSMKTLGEYNFNKAKINYSYSQVIDKLCNIYLDCLK